MSLAVLTSRALAGMQAPEVTVEVHLANGLPSFMIVGLPETEVKESKDRVRAALQNAGFEFPARRIKCCKQLFGKNVHCNVACELPLKNRIFHSVSDVKA